MKWSVRLEVGNYCNLRCPLCVREADDVDRRIINSIHLPLEDVKKFLPRFFLHTQVDTVFLSGAVAEPTLNPEFIDIVKYLMRYSRVVIDSNGSTRSVDWWAQLGATGVNCDFAPDSIKPNNNKYRINSNTDKVIENMRAFVAAGGVAEWKFIPYAHNEDELEEQRTIAESIGAKFTLIQPRWAKRGNIENSNMFPEEKEVLVWHDQGTPHNYCKLFGNTDVRLIEISPEGIIYPCCEMPREFYSVYRNYFIDGTTTPHIPDNPKSSHKSFIETIMPLIEDTGGIGELSLHKHSVLEILNGPFYTRLKQAWEEKDHFCNIHCHSSKYKLS